MKQPSHTRSGRLVGDTSSSGRLLAFHLCQLSHACALVASEQQ